MGSNLGRYLAEVGPGLSNLAALASAQTGDRTYGRLMRDLVQGQTDLLAEEKEGLRRRILELEKERDLLSKYKDKFDFNLGLAELADAMAELRRAVPAALRKDAGRVAAEIAKKAASECRERVAALHHASSTVLGIVPTGLERWPEADRLINNKSMTEGYMGV